MATNWNAVKVREYSLTCSELLEHLAMNGYTYDTNGEDVVFIRDEELAYLKTILDDRHIEYETL